MPERWIDTTQGGKGWLRAMREHVSWGLVAQALALTLAIIGVLGLVAWLLVDTTTDAGSRPELLPNLVQSPVMFIAFFLGTLFLSSRAIVDLLLGSPLAQSMPIADQERAQGFDANLAIVYLGFWVVNWVVVPAGTILGNAMAPRRGEGFGEYDHESGDARKAQ